MARENDERQGRAGAVAEQRRRRGDSEIRVDRNLDIPPEVQAWADAEGMALRWANDEKNRIHRLTVQDDYDKVPNVEPVPVGTTAEGAPIKAHLLAKRKDFIAEDRAKADERRRATEKALVRGENPAEGGNPNPASARRYVAPGTSIGRGNQVID